LLLLLLFCFSIVVFVVVFTFALLLVALLHLLSHLALFMPSALSCSRSCVLLPCYSHLFSCSHFHVLFIVACLHLIYKHCCSLTLFASSSCLLAYCSCLVVGIVFATCALLFSKSHWLFAPCCRPIIAFVVALLSRLIVALPSCLIATLPSHLAPSFFKYILAPPPPIVVSLPCCYALLIGTPSSFSYASGGAWSNTNNLHQIEVFFFPNP